MSLLSDSRHRNTDAVFSTPIFTALSLAAQRDFYNTPTVDRPFQAAKVSLWTSIAAGTSLITACIPSIRRFVMDWAAGVSNTIIGEGEIALSSLDRTKDSHTRGSRTGRSASRMWSPRGKQEVGIEDDNEGSRKRLTNQITQTTDIIVQSEALGGDKSSLRGRRSKGSSEYSLVAHTNGDRQANRLGLNCDSRS